jgi:hypothetical protein
MLHAAIGYLIQAGIGVFLLYLGKRVNEIHVLVNSKMTDALNEIAWLKTELSSASEQQGKHDE